MIALDRIAPQRHYTEFDLRVYFDLDERAIDRAVDAGRLRCIDVGKDRLFLGQWVIDWLTGQTTRRGGEWVSRSAGPTSG